MTTFIFYAFLAIASYFVIGYIVSLILIIRDRAGGKMVRSFLDFNEVDSERYSLTILLWPLVLGILAYLTIEFAWQAVVRAFRRINFAPIQPEALVNKIADRNKMTTIIEGKDAEDG